MRGIWFSELQTPDLAISVRLNQTLHHEKTPYQELAVVDTEAYGRMLLLDNIIQTTVKDEFFYHEMIAHVPLNTHPNPRTALVIGGGDGGVVREIVKHPSIEKVTLVEIDARVVANAREYLPEIACGLDDARVEIRFEDGIEHVRQRENTYDVIIVDSTDPIGPAVGLFSAEFYRNVYRALKADGVFVAQTESPIFNSRLIRRIQRDLKEIFPIARLYLTTVPTYPGGLWAFSLGSKKYDPLEVDWRQAPKVATRYYTPAIHQAAFSLPPFVQEFLEAPEEEEF
ncbi:polyamine aminopropyltransferase [Moorella thermoacetica]|uniref:Polyamine aminopropyltransferase n=1 Tax=Moorella thermoacetica (strain ATCC 39073 / JCM 9320) TaxID=264732 RepID=SPEE_MOOTA|nr:polyamine aminopropyltransferase [Moorella thermoacetica]Q2RHH3.1 RecName: Full=Polyamine aminopropyltransferase; AltName: Full=Putrescine aminopropyltransferase; Short=PAPT; AltName: Full=Spermidine synthase; Short=SPDS; Short=SPDSY [Moorella thermoacetica ATCC 39073]AKX97263.1 spermidine synthase [Moorella thermoacetica]OIQ57318.1 spermidine synthase [Moorella thermoacetica]QDA01092.1 Spermidine synthase [Moorella thermoacetica]TYL10250.1 Polyamine aminopropyltransferase [Moorella thermoa